MRTIQLLGLADGSAHDLSGQYVVSYDPEYHAPDGTYEGGSLICAPDIEKAGRWEIDDAVALWRSGPTCDCHSLRPDGKPNRPLTAFDVAVR
jgi:hypothetical protein